MDAIDAGGCAPPILATPKRCEAVAPVPNCDDVVANIKPAAFVVRGPDHAPFKAVSLTEHDDITAALRRQKDALQGEVSRLREDAAMFRWLTRYPNLYTVADLLKSDQYVTLRRACESLMPTDPDNLEPPTDGQ
jgi:hypothetical protein